jgi:hypothetical protein
MENPPVELDVAPPRVYVDASVFGGVFEEEHTEACTEFFRKAARGYYVACGSRVLEDELLPAPPRVRRFFLGVYPSLTILPVTDEVWTLAEGYLIDGVLPRKCESDLLHVAIATCGGCSSLISLNYKHLVSHNRQMAFNASNRKRGYNEVLIYEPEAFYFDGRE